MNIDIEKIIAAREQAKKAREKMPTAIEQANIARIEWQTHLIKKEAWQCCLNCEEWFAGSGPQNPMRCLLHNAMPPPEVFVVGCKDHMTDIPF